MGTHPGVAFVVSRPGHLPRRIWARQWPTRIRQDVRPVPPGLGCGRERARRLGLVADEQAIGPRGGDRDPPHLPEPDVLQPGGILRPGIVAPFGLDEHI
jgi:hypothetical protein